MKTTRNSHTSVGYLKIQSMNDNTTKVRTSDSRPVSLYDNFRENGTTLEKTKSKSLQNHMNHVCSEQNALIDKCPTQMMYLNTTVPQNISPNKIAGRHTPTRNSLRHSRMIVMHNRMGGPGNASQLSKDYVRFTKKDWKYFVNISRY